MMTPGHAAMLGRDDAEALLEYVTRLVMPEEWMVVVDGQHLSPSTRAIGRAESVWQAEDPDCWEAYEEALDAVLDAYDLNGEHLSWQEGLLCLYGAGYDEFEEAV